MNQTFKSKTPEAQAIICTLKDSDSLKASLVEDLALRSGEALIPIHDRRLHIVQGVRRILTVALDASLSPRDEEGNVIQINTNGEFDHIVLLEDPTDEERGMIRTPYPHSRFFAELVPVRREGPFREFQRTGKRDWYASM